MLRFVPESSEARRERPTFARPDHLEPLAAAFVRSLYEPVRLLVSVPPRHAKTETILHGIAWRLWLRPEEPIVYAAHTANFARDKSKRAKEIATAWGVETRRDSNSAEHWLTPKGGGLHAVGIGGPLTGYGAKLLVVDDPVKNREEAESALIRQKTFDWFTSTALTRVEPGGSVIVNMTRWHADDLIGRLAEESGWEYLNLAAIDDAGRALWPERWSAAALDVRRREVGPYDWASLYQGRPRPKGGALFHDAARYLDPGIASEGGWRIVIGCDPAATEKTSADFSAAVVLAAKGLPGTIDFRADVLEVWRGQIEIPKLCAKLAQMAQHWQCPVAIEAVAGFKAVPQILRQIDRSLRIFEVSAVGDKFTRALPSSAAWNDGRIRVPTAAPWLKDFLGEIGRFTGVKDAKDDQVDALSIAVQACLQVSPATALGVRRAPPDLR